MLTSKHWKWNLKSNSIHKYIKKSKIYKNKFNNISVKFAHWKLQNISEKTEETK